MPAIIYITYTIYGFHLFISYTEHQKIVLQNLPWARYEGFAYTRVELFHLETYRLYTDNPELTFTGYIHTTSHHKKSHYPSSKGSSIGYGSEYALKTVLIVSSAEPFIG